MPLVIVSWLWKPRANYRKLFRPLHVELLRERVADHCTLPHEFICITDQPAKAFSRHVRVVPLWPSYASLPPALPRGPSCYRRLRIFAPEAYQLLGVEPGTTIVSIDLDSIPCGPLAPLWDNDEEFIGWRASDRAPCCGSMFLHKLGTLTRVWTDFSFNRAYAESKRTGYIGTDQAWFAACGLAKSHGSWTTADGVYSFKKDCVSGLPADARIVFFHGRPSQWEDKVRAEHPWIVERYPLTPRPVEEISLARGVAAEYPLPV